MRLKQIVKDYMRKSDLTRQKYSEVLFRLYGEKKYKGVTYSIKF